MTLRNLRADVLVAGGGMAGVCAAIAAARRGAAVILIQDRPVLGGNASSEIRMHICGADCSGGRPDVDARESGIIEEIRLEDAVRNPQWSASMFDLLLWEWVKREPNLHLLLNTHVDGVTMTSPSYLAAVHATRPSTEEEFVIEASLFLDCTGDGRLGAEARADYRVGREARREYGESLAPPEADRAVLGSTLLFITREYDRPMPFVAPDWARVYESCEELPFRSHREFEYGYWWVEWGGWLDTIKDNERIRDELLRIVLGVWDHLKNRGEHGADRWALEWVGLLPGKRESRRFLGDHVLTQQDVQNAVPFPDAVAFGGWPIDLHPPEGIDSPEPPCEQHHVPELFRIPLRCLYSRNVENLLLAGRNVSATHVAFGATRVMATCAVMGQAAGTAAACCARQGCTPRELARDAVAMASLQQWLLKDDAYLIGVANADPDDLARTGTARASSETADGPASHVLNGVHRGTRAGTHRWISQPGLPQTLEVLFDGPQTVREVRLTFDTGLHRPLTLTHSQAFQRKMIRGPQPECVRDYTVEVLTGNGATPVAAVKNNHQRQRVHPFAPVEATGVRLTVHATHGVPEARVFEVRAYG